MAMHESEATLAQRLLILQETFAGLGVAPTGDVLSAAERGIRWMFQGARLEIITGDRLDDAPRPRLRRGRVEHPPFGHVYRAYFPGPPEPMWLIVAGVDVARSDEMRLAALFMEFLVSTLQAAGFRLQFEEQARTDWLTGLGNRRAFDRRLSVAGHSLEWLGIFDLDRLKWINDHHGHAAGDRLIKDFAELLGGIVGATHEAYRIGGDEFAVFVSEARRNEVASLVEDAPFGVSAGWARTDESTCEDLYRLADARMYESKRARRRALEASDTS